MPSPSQGMQGCKEFKQAFLKSLLLGLGNRGAAVASSRETSFHERKDAIKRAADAALASARGGQPCWSRTLAAELAHRRTRGTTAQNSGCKSSTKMICKKVLNSGCKSSTKMICKKVLRRRSLRPRRRKATTAYGSAGVLERAMVRKRTRVLKEIVPGGEGLDECTLLGETLDYAMSLRAQVDAMQLLARALQAPNYKA